MTIYLDADFCDAGNHFFCHQVMDADRTALSILYTDGQVLCLILMCIDTFAQGIAIAIRQRVTYRVPTADFCGIVTLFHSKHNILDTNVCHRAKSNRQCAIDILYCLRQVEAYSITPLPPLGRQGLVAV